jgi:hypothetical protein
VVVHFSGLSQVSPHFSRGWVSDEANFHMAIRYKFGGWRDRFLKINRLKPSCFGKGKLVNRISKFLIIYDRDWVFMLVKTTKCHEFGHPELCFEYDPEIIHDPDINFLRNFFEYKVESGVIFKTDETIQIGWMLCKFQLREDGCLYILEPDFESFPIVFVDSVTNTLRHLRQQKDAVESIYGNVELTFPSILGSICVSKTYKNATSAFLSREAPEDRFSGWFIQDLESGGDEGYELISLYDFACNRPDLVKFLAFPPQYGVQICPENGFIVITEDRDVSLIKGSFLDLINIRGMEIGRGNSN